MEARMAMTAYLNDVPRSTANGRASRRQLRLPLHGSKATGSEIEAFVHNISATGMLVESRAPLEIGEVIEVNLPHSGKTATKVIWTSGGLAGCQFEMPISPATLSAAQLKKCGGARCARPRRRAGPGHRKLRRPSATAARGKGMDSGTACGPAGGQRAVDFGMGTRQGPAKKRAGWRLCQSRSGSKFPNCTALTRPEI